MSDDPLAGERESADPLAEPHRENPETPSAETAPASDGEAREPAQPDGEASLAAQGELADDVPILVVGVAASAGGLEAFNELLHNLPADTGMAFVCVQHLDPRYRSNLAEILKRATPMAVTEIADGTRLEPNHVYVMPANSDLAMLHRVLRVMPRTDPAGSHMPIDGFFRSLAEDRGSRAIGVVLSGAGSDGALGLRAIQAAGGITFAQDPSTAKHAGMPSSAAAMGVDFVLPAAGIAQELVRIAHAPLVRSLVKGRAVLLPLPQDDLQRLFILLRRGTGVDFSLYKRTTVERRIARRLVLHRLESLSQYVRYLQQNAGEMNALFEDMLINVTCFFRDPESFEALKQSIFPRMLQDKPRDVPIRIWVPGCSTGEEAYSLAIVLLEYLSEQEQHWPIQVFATDVSNEAVQKARDARYPENIAADVSPERLQRYFLREDGGYQISKTVRDMCVVAKQNVIKDPPFSNLDLISCRNLLIYMGPALQKRIIPTFHYALRPGGHLLLGSAETSGGFADLFVLADKKHKFYARKPVPARLPPEFGPIAIDTPAAAPKESSAATSAPPGPVDAEREIDRLLLSRFPVHGVVVDANLNIVHVRGQTGRFLELAPGRTSWNLMKMTREGLALDVRTAIHKAKVDRAPIRKEGLRIQHNGGQLLVNLEILPFRPGEGDEFQYLVLFEEGKPAAALARPSPSRSPAARAKAKSTASWKRPSTN